MNLKCRKKPVVIDAWQFTKENYINGVPQEFKHTDVSLWMDCGCDAIGREIKTLGGEIKTLEGKHIVTENDWIIKGVKGEFYPCKPDIFDVTYEVA